MKKVFICLGFLIILIVNLLSSAVANTQENLDSTKLTKPVDDPIKVIRELKNNLFLSTEQKNRKIIFELITLQSLYKDDDYNKILQDNEEIIFSTPKTIDDVINQIQLLSQIIGRRGAFNGLTGIYHWPLKHSPIEVLEKMKSISEIKICTKNDQCFAYADDPIFGTLNIDGNFGIYYRDTGQLEKYQEMIDKFQKVYDNFPNDLVYSSENDKLSFKKYRNQWKQMFGFFINGYKYRLSTLRGSLPEVIEESRYIDQHYKEIVSWLEEMHASGQLFSMMSPIVEIDQYLGRNDEVIDKVNYLLSKIPEDSNLIEILNAKSTLIKIKANAYQNKKDYVNGSKYKNEAMILDLKTGVVDNTIIGYVEFENLSYGTEVGYDNASKLNYLTIEACKKNNDIDCVWGANLFQNLIETYKFIDSDKNRSGGIGISYDIQDKKIVINSVNFDSPAFKAGIRKSDKIISINDQTLDNLNNNQVRDLLLGPVNSELKIQVIKNNSDVAKNISLIRSDMKQEVMKGYWNNFATYYESVPYELKGHGIVYDESNLANFSLLFGSYKSSKNNYLASVYAKKYINLLQKLRSDLASSKSDKLKDFTDSQASKLEEFADVFFDIGEYNNAWACQKIIKENQFLDYVRRRGVDKEFFTNIEFDNAESDYLSNLNKLNIELNELNRQINSIQDKSGVEYKKKLEALNNIILKKDDLKNSFIENKSGLLKKPSEILATNPLSIYKLSNKEAAISLSIIENKLVVFLSSNQFNKKFTNEINVNGLREKILNLNLAVNDKKDLPKEIIGDLSQLIISDSFRFLEDKNISEVKFITDNNFQALPLAILKYKNKNINEIYTIEKIGLHANNSIQNKTGFKNIIGFAATKGNQEFAKLSGAGRELDNVMNLKSNMHFDHSYKYTDSAFNQSTFSNSFKSNNFFVHVATHFKIQGNTANSTKMLLGDGKTLSLEDIRNDLPALNTYLVTLSACNTADKVMTSNQKYEGLSDTFQTKGAKNVISTLWEISDDATADFMSIFYSLLLNNKISPPEALTYTQIIFNHGSIDNLPKNILLIKDNSTSSAIKNLSKYTNPYYWAAFQISTIN